MGVFYLDPSHFKSIFERNVIKALAQRIGAKIVFKETILSDKRNFRKGFFYIEFDDKHSKKVESVLKSFNIKFYKAPDRAEAYFDEGIINYMGLKLPAGVPIGISKETDRLVIVEMPNLIVSRDPLTAIYFSILSKNAIWIGKLFEGYDRFFNLLDGIPVKSLPSERVVELSEYISLKLLGKKDIRGFKEALLSASENLLEDIELNIGSEAEQLVKEVYSWGVLKKEGEFSARKYILDISGLPLVAKDISILASIIAGFKLIVIEGSNFDKELLKYLSSNQSVIVVDREATLEAPFRVLVDSNGGELTKKVSFGEKKIYLMERFYPLWSVFEEGYI